MATRYIGKVGGHGWSLAQAKHRIRGHRQAAQEADSEHVRMFHLREAEHWETLIGMFLERRGVPNLIMIDWYRPHPLGRSDN